MVRVGGTVAGAPWRGQYVAVHPSGRWCFYRCVVCGQPVGDRVSRRAGVGRGCAAKLSETGLEGIVARVVAQERVRYRDEVGLEPPEGF
jgi:hypothetical protein